MTLRSLSAAAAVLLGTAMMAFAAPAAERAEARLTLTLEAAGPRIEPAVYGQFVEHLGTGVYGGLWVGTDSKIPNTRGFRNDVIAALRKIKVPVVRWPGGCFADDYDWRDGIGPRAQRPVRLNKVWGNVPDDNRVGTHEFMDFAEMIGAEVYIAGNMGSMPPRAMAQWLEYMTSDSVSSLANERRRNGRDKPWTVKYFGVGNESWGCGGHMRPEYAADLHRQYASFLRAPVIKVASGDGEGNERVTDVMMDLAKDDMDAISLHHYTVPGPWEAKGQAVGFDAQRWAKTLQDVTVGMEEHIAKTVRIMDKHDPKKRVALYVDEWGMWHDPEPGSNPAFLVQQNTLRDAMVAALTFNVFHRHTERVKMANIAQMVNVLQAMVLTDGARMLLTPTYHLFDLYLPFQGATPLKASVDAPRYRQGEVSLPAVDVSAARGVDGSTLLALVNLDPERAARVVTNLAGTATGRILSAAAMDAHNSFDRPDTIVPAPYVAKAVAGKLSFDLPAKSIVVVSIPVPAVAQR
ncbi:alpha-N-arabinofuranosidase [Aquabacterium sp.]|uniref:alpha-N-arabinofuranosidase n=1 Tax=Aquabacterium sp. TaxID=1872578 RepID=UPI002BA0F807|nr:alpha-L-arabinofuranosidase C-terminal domain-containing protein [Aquabacterium sp.]HSW05982.1 alpha-L-arabinofuranosidase C-terminal domain-containing protein [Aquabacterium sp.]